MQKLFGAPKIPAPTAITTAPPTPLSDDEELRKARIKAAAAIQNRSGRASTFLSGTNDKLGA